MRKERRTRERITNGRGRLRWSWPAQLPVSNLSYWVCVRSVVYLPNGARGPTLAWRGMCPEHGKGMRCRRPQPVEQVPIARA